MNRVHKVLAMQAVPIGIPGCPEFAFWTASMARPLTVETIVAWSDAEMSRGAKAARCDMPRCVSRWRTRAAAWRVRIPTCSRA